MTDPAKVKGVVLRGVLKDVKERYPPGIASFLDQLPGQVRGEFFAANIVHGMWYPYAAFVALLEGFHSRVGHGRTGAVTELGMRAAERDLGTLLKIYSVVSTPHRVGRHGGAIWQQRFRNAGDLIMTQKQDRGFALAIENFAAMHPLHCEFLTGYGMGAGRSWEKSFKVVHDSCVHRGGAVCSYVATW